MSTRDPGDRRLLDRRYRVERIVATRPLGRIYQARHIGLDAVVLLTELRCPPGTPTEARERARARFFEDARQLTALSHPGLPRIHDYFSAGDACILVSDCVEGESLAADIERSGPIPVRSALGYALQLCDTFAYLHRLQPPLALRGAVATQVIITPQDRAVPVDLGITRRFAQALRGDVVTRLATRDDVVALAALLFTMTEGTNPPAVGTDLRSALEHAPRTPQVVTAVVLRALDQSAPDAITSVFELGRALQAAARTLFGPLRSTPVESSSAGGTGSATAADPERPTLGTEPMSGSAFALQSAAAARGDASPAVEWWRGTRGGMRRWQGPPSRRSVATRPRRRNALLGLGAASVALAASLAVAVAAGLPSGRLGNAQSGSAGPPSSATVGAGASAQPNSADGQLVGTPPRANPPVRQEIQPPTPTPRPPTPTPRPPTPVPTVTPVPSPTPTTSPTPTPTPTPSPTPTPTPTPTATPSATPTAMPTPTPSVSPTPIPTGSPTPSPQPPTPSGDPGVPPPAAPAPLATYPRTPPYHEFRTHDQSQPTSSGR